MILGWIRFWDRRESGEALALMRILVALVILYDFTCVLRLGLVDALWAPIDDQGIGPATRDAPVATFYEWFGASAQNAQLLIAGACVAAVGLCIGIFTRASAVLLLVTYAQLAQLSPGADRGIDTLLRNVLLLLACSRAGATLSLDARLRHGQWLPVVSVPAWPRYLIVVQLSLMYFMAGILKQSAAWTSLGGYSALFLVLNHPHFARFVVSRDLLLSSYPVLQLATLLTVAFERAAIVVPVLVWFRLTRTRRGVLRTFANRARLLEIWIILGATFHVGLALTLLLGIFPWGCLALYPSLASPESIRRVMTRCGALCRDMTTCAKSC